MFVALGILHAMRMRHIFICGLASSTVFFSYYLIIARLPEEKKKSVNKNHVFWASLQLLSEIFPIIRINEGGIVLFAQGESHARGSKLLSIKNYVIQIMT